MRGRDRTEGEIQLLMDRPFLEKKDLKGVLK